MKEWTQAELNRLYRYALALADRPEEAYDLMQQALLRWLEGDTGQVRVPQAYVMRSIRNLHFDRHRRSQRWDEVNLDDSEPIAMETYPLEEVLIAQQEVAALLASLQSVERELLYLWAVEGYTVDEISAFTDVPRGTLLSRLYRLRRKLIDAKSAGSAKGETS